MSQHTVDVEPVTDRVHENSWSVNLEKPAYADNLDRLEAHVIEAVEKTAPGNHVNLVTHADHGHPADYLFDVLADAFPDAEWRYVEQCGCGGHVTRVQVV